MNSSEISNEALARMGKYIRAIRNKEKKTYAYRCATAMMENAQEPDRHSLSVMGAQAVRISLAQCLRETIPPTQESEP
jgi:hypothetical protein